MRVPDIVTCAIAAVIGLTAAAWGGTGSAWTYQGHLIKTAPNVPYNGPADFIFDLYAQEIGGVSQGTVPLNGVLVVDGRFTVLLDFGSSFKGAERWLEIRVDIGDGFTLLTPRQKIRPTPQAQFADQAQAAQGEFRIREDPLTLTSTLFFGPTDECSFGIEPGLTGLIERDPVGLRLLGPGPGGTGCQLLFGPTDDCTIRVFPPGLGPPGLVMTDPECIRIINPFPDLPAKIVFTDNDLCWLGVDPLRPGLTGSDPSGLRIDGPGADGRRVVFGPTDECRIWTDPKGFLPGLILQDPTCIRIINPLFPAGVPIKIQFGDLDDCWWGIDPGQPGLTGSDPDGIRVNGPGDNGRRVTFGTDDLCWLGVNPTIGTGLIGSDPDGLRIRDPFGGFGRLRFGDTDECEIEAGNGMCFRDPILFKFIGGFVGFNVPDPTVGIELPIIPGPEGIGRAFEWQSFSSRRWKENIRPIDDPLAIVDRLEGVRFSWKANGRTDIGFIAEDVARVLPEVVTMEPDGTAAKAMDYGRIGAVTIEALKMQQEQIAALRADNEALKSRLARLEDALLERVATREGGDR